MINQAAAGKLGIGASRIAIYVGLYELTHLLIQKPLIPSVLELIPIIPELFSAPIATAYIATCSRWISVFMLGVGLGSVIGAILGYFRIFGHALAFDIDFWRSLPATVLVQFFFALLGDNEITRVLPAFYVAFFTAIYYVSRAGSGLDRKRFEHLYTLGASDSFVIWNAYVYEVLPSVILAGRQAISLSFLVLVSTELIIGSSNDVGIGNRLVDWLFYAQYGKVILVIFLLGLTGYLANRFAALSLKLVYWRETRGDL